EDAAIPEAHVEADVEERDALPAQVRAGEQGLGQAGLPGVVLAARVERERLEVADVVVTRDAVAGAQLQLVEEVGLEERLLRDAPGDGAGGEETVAIVLAEARGAVEAAAQLDDVAVVVGEGGTPEVRLQAPLAVDARVGRHRLGARRDV